MTRQFSNNTSGIAVGRLVSAAAGPALLALLAMGLAGGWLVRGPSAQALVSSWKVTAEKAAVSRPAGGGGLRDDDGYIEGLAATLGYEAPELMATGSIRAPRAVVQR